MRLFYIKPSLAVLIYAFFISALFVPEISYADYGGRHHSSYSHHHGRRHSSHSLHYGYGHSGRSHYYANNRYGRPYYYPYHYYRRNHYSSRRQGNYQSYGPYSVAVPAAINIYSGNNKYQQSRTDYSGMTSSAWQVLSQGQYNDALNVFANEAQRHPDSGVPKAGYALATAATGDLERGVWAMQRAFRIDPDSLHHVQLDESSHRLVNHLIAQYIQHKNGNTGDQDFMVSALYYLKHDYLAAKRSITAAQSYENNKPSIFNLNRLIEQQLETGQIY